jgi:L-ascorbate metabolism protein UlaG (beta-lactamase superfamily)
MKITKFGHCCLLIEEKGLRILTDPGSFTTQQNTIKDIDVVLITHEHMDHFHINSLKNILKNNATVKILTNKAVGKLLDKEKIKYELVQDKQHIKIKNVLIEGFGTKHAEMHSSIPPTDNTGYFIDNRLFYPGDAFTIPGKNVEILALPVAGPWMKISEAMDYAIGLRPKICFPVHDAVLAEGMQGFAGMLAKNILEPKRITFVQMNAGDTKEF